MTFERLSIIAACAFCLVVLAQLAGADEKPPVFESDIQPIFAARCGTCHGEKLRKGGLDLSSITGIQRGGESGDLIAETVEDSLLWTMIDGGSMPPEDQPSLNAHEKDLIRQWLAAGSPSETPAEKVITQHDVLPMMYLRCTACHGARLQQGGVDLRTVSAIRLSGKNGPVLIPGNPDDSLIVQRIESEACPPRDQLLKFFVKRPPTSEVKRLREWIAAGALEVDIPLDPPATGPDPLVTDEDRQHWAFQPPKASGAGQSIDDFVIQKLSEAGLEFSPEADRDTLIRRVSIDLTGLPPRPDEWNAWRSSRDPDWYQKMVDHLLASPRYGERWGRYWLDLAGYADSEGGVSSDPVREVAWKYRDYVIHSFNDDKPYDRFLLEQIAGDELLDAEKAPVVTEEMVENLTATGFLRMGIDQTGSRTMNFVPERIGVISDAITVLGSGVMGLTLECARCHSHKYDPIPHRDYYRFKAIFQGALDEHDWLSFATRSLEVATPEHRKQFAEVNPPLTVELKKLQSRLNVAIADVQIEMLRQHDPDQSEADRSATLKALKVADNSRTLTERTLVENLQRIEALPDSEQSPAVMDARRVVEDLEREIEQVRRRMVPPLAIRALWDRGDPSPTYILRRGEYDKPGDPVGPGVPAVLMDGQTPFVIQPPFPEGTPRTGRRLAFARWLIQPNHPLTARVFVNRIWHHHLGAGIVRSLENFGRKGDYPSHPELLDWLAVKFVSEGWSVKQLHRLILNSQTYRQSSHVTEEQLSLDPQNRLLSRMPLRRMDAETVRDSLLFVSGQLDETPGGLPDSVSVDRDGLVSVNPTSDGRWRRSVYVQYRRTEIPSMIETFDYPEMVPNCIARSVSVVSPQSLMMMNNEHVRHLAAALAARIESLIPSPETDNDPVTDAAFLIPRIEAVYQLALSRDPDDSERRLGLETLKSLQGEWQGDFQAALVTYCHTLLNSAAFLYVD